MKKSILLTGHNGFLGKKIHESLKTDSNFFTRTCSRFDDSDFSIDLSINVPYFNSQFDVVIHSAGKAHSSVKKGKIDSSFHKVNVIGTENLLIGLTKYPPKYFVLISSVSVYGLTDGLNIDESFPLLAKDSYGKSKIDAESLVKNWCDKYDVICTILRLPLIVGDYPPGNLGSMIHGIKYGYYFIIGDGNFRKSMVLGSDVAYFVLKAAKYGGIFNLTDGYHPTLNEFTLKILQNLKKSFVPRIPFFLAVILAKIGDIFGNNFVFNSTKLAKMTSSLIFDDSKARFTFGWKPNVVLKSSFKFDRNI